MTIQKLFCKIMLRSFVLILGLISVTELSANPEFVYSASSLESSVTAPQGGGGGKKKKKNKKKKKQARKNRDTHKKKRE